MVVGFVAINQFSRDSVTSVHVCPKSYATHATLSVQVWGARGGVAGYSAAAVVDARRVASSTIELLRCEAVESQKSAQVPVAPLYCAKIVGRGREASQPFHFGGDEAVTVTMPVVSLDDFPRL